MKSENCKNDDKEKKNVGIKGKIMKKAILKKEIQNNEKIQQIAQ